MSVLSRAAGRADGDACWLVDVHAARGTAESRRTRERGEIIDESMSGDGRQ